MWHNDVFYVHIIMYLKVQITAGGIRELLSPRYVQSASWQSASWRIRELSSYPTSPEMITRFRESYSSVSMSRESKRLKKSSSDWLNSGNAVYSIWVKNAISVFSRFAR